MQNEVLDDRLEGLIRRGYESKDLDYKSAAVWNAKDKAACCELVKDVLAMANSGGGFIVVGVAEEASGFDLVGLSEEELKSFETTRLNQFVQRYADPPINSILHKRTVEGKTFVVVRVPGFPNVPHICVKSYPEVLTTPTIYVRTANNESAPVSSSADLQGLIELGTRNRADAILASMRSIMVRGPTEVRRRDGERFEEQYEEAVRSFGERNAQYAGASQTGFREASFFPARFQADALDPDLLRPALERASVRLGGFPFIYARDDWSALYAIQDGCESTSAWPNSNAPEWLQFWQLRTSGFFFHRQLMPEDARPCASGTPRIADVDWTLFHIVEAINAMCLLYEALELGTGPTTLRIRLLGTNGRQLHERELFGGPRGYQCQIEAIKVGGARPLAEWKAGTADIAAEMMRDVCRRFNWNDPPVENFRERAQTLLAGRL